MVVYLYKKGRQTMKNIITTIAMFILTITAQAQTITTDSFYTFTHDTTVSSFDALENNKCVKFGWNYGKTKYEIDEANKYIMITYIKSGVVQYDYLTIINIVVEGVAKQYNIHSENSGVNGDIIFTKDAEHKVDMVVSRYILDGRMVVNESYVN
jgi:hypothetical protein